jgi:hypothetical protein
MRRLIFGATTLSILTGAMSMAQTANDKFVPLTDTEKLVCETMIEGIELSKFSESDARKEYQALIKRWETEKAEFAGRVNTQNGNPGIGFKGHGTDFLNQSEKIRKGLLVDIDKRQNLDAHNAQNLNSDFKDFVQSSKATLDRKISEQKEQLKSLFTSNFSSYYLNTATEENKKIRSEELWSPVTNSPAVNGQQITMTAQTTDSGIPFLRTATLDLKDLTLTLETKKETEGSDSFKYVTVFSLRDRSNVYMKTISGENEIVLVNGNAVSPDNFIKLARERHQKSLHQSIILSGAGLSENSKKALYRCATHRLSSNYGKSSEATSKELAEATLPSGDSKKGSVTGK